MKFIQRIFNVDARAPLRTIAQMQIRPITPLDIHAYTEFVSKLSPLTKYQRTLGGAVNPTQAQLISLVSPDINTELVLGVFSESGEQIYAVGRFAPATGDASVINSAEFAITVADESQGQGLGTTLLKRLKVAAVAMGYQALVATVFADNHAMLALATAQGCLIKPALGDGAVRAIYCDLSEVAALFDENTLTPSITPKTSKAMPRPLKKPGKSRRQA
jgi:GNAT superfamily N-acetyltransferase